MKPFTMSEYYKEWLESFRAMISGGAAAKQPTPREAQVAATQEWEDEGGSIKPEKKPNEAPAPKMPL